MATDLVLSIQNFLKEIDHSPAIREPPTIYLDASSAIHAAVAPAMLPKFKHIAIHAQKLRTRCQYGDIVLSKVDSKDNMANQGTKPYASKREYLQQTSIYMMTHEELLGMGFKLYVPDSSGAPESAP